MKAFSPSGPDEIIARFYRRGTTITRLAFLRDTTREEILEALIRTGVKSPQERFHLPPAPVKPAASRRDRVKPGPAPRRIEADHFDRSNIAESSRALLTALLRYGARHGLPNISAADCSARLGWSS